MKRVLIVSPVFNEEEVLPEFVHEIGKLRAEISGEVDIHLLLVDDGSTDASLSAVRGAQSANPDWIFYLSFTSNFGHQAALIAGLTYAGIWPEAIITMDSDLEHPVALVPELIRKWQNEKCMLVNTIRKEAAALGWRKRLLSKLFYQLARRLTALDLQPGQADFRLWDARLLHSLHSYLPNIGSLRVFAAWLPVRKGVVEYDQCVRPNRTSRFTFKKNWDLAVISIVRFSNVPLRSIAVMGVMGILFTFLYAMVVSVRYWMGYSFPGWTNMFLTVTFMGSLQLASLGILASYLKGLVFSKDLPLYIVDESKNGP